MALAISTNFAINANTALNAMNKSQSLMAKSINRISTGNRAANPADDPLSYFSGNKIKGDIEGYDALYNGVQDAAAQANIADSALSSIIDVLTEMKAKATAYDNTTDSDSKAAINNAYKQLSYSLDSFIDTQYKGSSVWNSSLTVQTSLGATADDSTTEINLYNEVWTNAGVSAASGATTQIDNTAGGAKGSVTLVAGIKAGTSENADTFAGTLTLAAGSSFLSAYDDLEEPVTFKLAWGSGTTFKINYAGQQVGTATFSDDSDSFKFSKIEFNNANAKTIDLTDDGSPTYSDISDELKEWPGDGTDDPVSFTNVSKNTATTLQGNWKYTLGTDNKVDTKTTLSNSTTSLKDYTFKLAAGSDSLHFKIYNSADTNQTQLGTLTIGAGAITKLEWVDDESAWSTAGITKSGSSSTSSGQFAVNGLSKPDSTLSGLTGGASLSANKATAIQTAIDTIAKQRTELGGSLSALDGISSNLSSVSTATEAAYTAVTEANIAKEMTNYVRNNVYSQAAQAMISQANQSLAQVLNLLQ